MSRSRPHERHIFPPGDDMDHTASAWCRCKPAKRVHRFSAVYVHNVLADQRSSR